LNFLKSGNPPRQLFISCQNFKARGKRCREIRWAISDLHIISFVYSQRGNGVEITNFPSHILRSTRGFFKNMEIKEQNSISRRYPFQQIELKLHGHEIQFFHETIPPSALIECLKPF